MRSPVVAERVGSNLGEARRRAGVSQEELGRLCSLHRTEVSLIERGRRTPLTDTLIKLATALEVPVDELLVGVEWVPPAPGDGGQFVVSGG
jgi:transcriptional regulator with XRE-family HTH domain